MSYRMQLNRFNIGHQPISFDSREYGYLILTLIQNPLISEISDEDHPDRGTSSTLRESKSPDHGTSSTLDSGFVVNPIKIRFVPDPKLSVNQIMEFKKFQADMRMVLGRNQADGGLKICYREGQISLHLTHYTSEMEIKIPNPDLDQMRRILDQLCIVISTNTFFKLDLVEIKTSAKKSYQEITNYLWSAWK